MLSRLRSHLREQLLKGNDYCTHEARCNLTVLRPVCASRWGPAFSLIPSRKWNSSQVTGRDAGASMLLGGARGRSRRKVRRILYWD